MKIKWLGHACFLVTSREGLRIIFDPYKAEQYLSYPEVKQEADIVIISHDHYDHNCTAGIKGNPEIIKGSGTSTTKGVTVRGVDVWHDESGGKERGGNTIFNITVDDLSICHCGDLGHLPNDKQIKQIGDVDILLFPIGGVFTIGIDLAADLLEKLKPKIAIPMHYKTDRCTWLKYSADDFAKDRSNVIRSNSSEVDISRDKLPATTEIIILQYSH